MEVLIKNDDFPHYAWKERAFFGKGGLISEGILNLVPLPTKSAKSLPGAENLNFS